MSTRTERDALGGIEVPAERLWGAATERARRNFPAGDRRLDRRIWLALTEVKRAAAVANAVLGRVPEDVAGAIVRACDEVLAGAHDDEFPLSPWQSGSGTQSHMNVNEVLANRASELLGGERGPARLVHPNDHVGHGQSSNDVFPAALHVAAVCALRGELLPAVSALCRSLEDRERAFRGVVKLGRTHLMDAVPLGFDQVVSGWRAQVQSWAVRAEQSVQGLLEVPVGGTAVGTGLNAHPELGERVAAELRRRTGFEFRVADNRFAALASADALVAAHAALSGLSGALLKVADDVRWLGSGPRGGLGELRLPANEPGSSAMPGKVNPTQCEALRMIAIRVLSNHHALSLGSGLGNLELCLMRPLVGQTFFESVTLLAAGTASFEERCVRGLEVDRAAVAGHLERSLMQVTALVPHLGYDEAAAIARKAEAEGITLRAAALARGSATEAELEEWLRVEGMLGPR